MKKIPGATKMVNKRGISRTSMLLLVSALLVMGIAIGFAEYHSETVGPNQTKVSSQITGSLLLEEQNVSEQAYSHWNYMSQKNLSSLIFQYSAQYQAVWFFFSGNDSLSSLNGRHDCNPAGGIDCSYNVKTAWQTFFNETPSFTSHSVCNYSLTVELGERILVSAIVWLQASATNQSSDRIATLEVPYQIDFELVGGSYQLWKEYFGIPNDPVVVFDVNTSPPPSSQCS